ncbi:DUF6886 family protein [Parafilimonas sp.]|uniref:DUF6886 family protein n=1 Tax=Parafilimonas sp. TaxID=1969739 RepID=UPI0039E3D5F7
MHAAQPRLFHISETSSIDIFIPRPSPSYLDNVHGDVVFAVSEKLLHNYLLPRDCPRVTYYADEKTTQQDRDIFLVQSNTKFVVAIEAAWLSAAQHTAIFCYELPADNFKLADACAGYFVSYVPVNPLSVTCIGNPLKALLQRGNIELRVMPSLQTLSIKVAASSLAFSIIRMRNAVDKENNKT